MRIRRRSGSSQPIPSSHPFPTSRSFIYTLRFPEQEHKLLPGAEAIDAASERSVNVVEIDDTAGIVRIRRAQSRHGEALPAGLIPGGPYNTVEQRAALRRLADTILTSGIDGPGPLRVLRDVLLRMPTADHRHGERRGSPGRLARHRTTRASRRAARRAPTCSSRVRPGQARRGPARSSSSHLLHSGARVGVAATSHKAIHNLLHEIEETAVERQLSFQGWKKCSADNPESEYNSKLERSFITNESNRQAFPPPDDVQLLAGTAWLFAPESMDGTLDYLILDLGRHRDYADRPCAQSRRALCLMGVSG